MKFTLGKKNGHNVPLSPSQAKSQQLLTSIADWSHPILLEPYPRNTPKFENSCDLDPNSGNSTLIRQDRINMVSIIHSMLWLSDLIPTCKHTWAFSTANSSSAHRQKFRQHTGGTMCSNMTSFCNVVSMHLSWSKHTCYEIQLKFSSRLKKKKHLPTIPQSETGIHTQ